jgi:hypothetical protein
MEITATMPAIIKDHADLCEDTELIGPDYFKWASLS